MLAPRPGWVILSVFVTPAAVAEYAYDWGVSQFETTRLPVKGRDGDCINAVLAAAGYNFTLFIKWFEALLRALITAVLRASFAPHIT